MSKIIKTLSLISILFAVNNAFASWPVVSENFIDEDLYQYRGSERLQGSYWDDRVGIAGARKSISITTGMTLTGARLNELARRGVQFNLRDITKVSASSGGDGVISTAPRSGVARVDLYPYGGPAMISQMPAFETSPAAVPAPAPIARVNSRPAVAAAKPASLPFTSAPRTVSASSAIKSLRMLQGR